VSGLNISRRSFLVTSGLAAATLAACSAEDTSSSPGGAASSGGADAAPKTTFTEPTSKLGGTLKILMWSHFVPRHDKWFDEFAKDWGKKVGVEVTVDHINTADIPARIAAEIQAGAGHDLVQHISAIPQYEPSVVDLTDLNQEAEKRFGKLTEICQKSSFNPHTNKYYAYAPGWVPDPGDYRKSLWADIGMADGPKTWDDLLAGGSEIKSKQKVQMGIGMSQEIDSNMAGRALMWSYGGAVQDADGKVTLNSPETVAAVEYMKQLFEKAMTPEVFSWTAASNNQGLVAGKLSYVLNSISAYRSAQLQNPKVAEDVLFSPALKGPKDGIASSHVMYNWIVPSFSKSVDNAKEFMLHYTANFASATYYSELYDFSAFEGLVPQLDGWLAKDPFGSKPADKLTVLKDSMAWTTNLGHPGPANTAVGEVNATFIIPNMYAQAARGDKSPQQAVADAHKQVEQIFAKWRSKGLIG
jgi:ABC-type glycerol-3-phosphate transport system substrate-binding protein